MHINGPVPFPRKSVEILALVWIGENRRARVKPEISEEQMKAEPWAEVFRKMIIRKVVFFNIKIYKIHRSATFIHTCIHTYSIHTYIHTNRDTVAVLHAVNYYTQKWEKTVLFAMINTMSLQAVSCMNKNTCFIPVNRIPSESHLLCMSKLGTEFSTCYPKLGWDKHNEPSLKNGWYHYDTKHGMPHRFVNKPGAVKTSMNFKIDKIK